MVRTYRAFPAPPFPSFPSPLLFPSLLFRLSQPKTETALLPTKYPICPLSVSPRLALCLRMWRGVRDFASDSCRDSPEPWRRSVCLLSPVALSFLLRVVLSIIFIWFTCPMEFFHILVKVSLWNDLNVDGNKIFASLLSPFTPLKFPKES